MDSSGICSAIRRKAGKARKMEQAGKVEIDEVCGNCNHSFPSGDGVSTTAICLKDSEFEPYVDRLLEEDFRCCAEIIARKRFPLDRPACADFEPMEDIGDGEELSPELSKDIEALAAKGQLTTETLESAVAVEAFRRTDWSKAPVEERVRRLQAATTVESRKEELNGLGFLVCRRNRAAFDALSAYLWSLPPPQTPDDCHFRSEVLRHIRLWHEWDREVACLLVKDLLRTPSNNHTRSWYTEVLGFFDRCSADIAEEALQPILDSPAFSYRIKRRVRAILDFRQ